MISETEDKRKTIVTKDTPIALAPQEIPKALAAMSQECGERLNKYEKCILTI